MPEDSKKPRTVYSFQDAPPEIAYLDASFLLNVLVKESTFHTECAEFAKRLEAAGTFLILSNLGLDEIWFVLLRLLAVQEHGETGWLGFLHGHPEKVREFAKRLEEATLEIVQIPNLLLVELTTSQSLQALSLISQFGLLPRDALHAAATIESGLNTIITTDADFARVSGLTIYSCNHKILQV